MKFYSKLLFLLLFFYFSISSFTQNNIVFSIDNDAYTLDQLQEIYKKDSQYLDESSNFKDFVNSFIYTKLLEKEAKAISIDTNFVYSRDLATLKQQLINQSLKPSIVYDDFVNQYTKLFKEEYELNQVFIPFDSPAILPKDTVAYFNKALKIREHVLESGFDEFNKHKHFETFGIRINPEVENGYVGWIRPFMMSHGLEDVVFSLEINEVSQPVREEKGYHIFQLLSKRPMQGVPVVDHVMFNFPLVPAPTAVKDSVYAVAQKAYTQILEKNNFDEICNQFKRVFELESCSLGPVDFNSTAIPATVISASYALDSINEVSQPIFSEYGYHIVRLSERLPIPNESGLRKLVLKQLEDKTLKAHINKKLIPDMMKKNGIVLENTPYNALRDITELYSPTDSMFYASVKNGDDILFSVDSVGGYTVNDFLAYANLTKMFYMNPMLAGSEEAMEQNGVQYSTALRLFLSTDILDDMIRGYALILDGVRQKHIISNSNEFKQAYDKFADELLVTTLLDRTIWVKVKTDMDGLNKVFESNKSEFSFNNSPHFKGKIVFAKNDSIINDITNKFPSGEISSLELKKLYREGNKNLIKVEEGLWQKGDNQIVDEYIFLKEKTNKDDISYAVIGKLLYEPENFTDVLSQVQNKYRQQLEDELKEKLYSKYKVEINKKLIKKVK